MLDFYKIEDSKIAESARFIRDEIKRRGWPKVEAMLTAGDGGWMVFATRPDGKEVRFRSATPETTSSFAQKLATEKSLGYEILARVGAKYPETCANPTDEEVLQMLDKYGTLAVKPEDGAHGDGITLGVNNLAEAKKAIEQAKNTSEMGCALVQKQLDSNVIETRVICIGYQFVVALERVPATVTGDGEHSLAELIEIENQTIRTEAYESRLARIPMEAALRFLGERQSQVPNKGEQVRVLSIANIGQGGTVNDVSERWTPEMRDEAEKIARGFRLPVIGIDYLEDYVLEVNSCPGLYYNMDGPAATIAVQKYVDYLESI